MRRSAGAFLIACHGDAHGKTKATLDDLRPQQLLGHIPGRNGPLVEQSNDVSMPCRRIQSCGLARASMCDVHASSRTSPAVDADRRDRLSYMTFQPASTRLGVCRWADHLNCRTRARRPLSMKIRSDCNLIDRRNHIAFISTNMREHEALRAPFPGGQPENALHQMPRRARYTFDWNANLAVGTPLQG